MTPRSTLSLRNRQRCRPIQLQALRQITRALLSELWPDRPFVLCLHLVGLPEITRVNERFLRHAGPTDVITFDHSAGQAAEAVYGEIFLCVDMAVRQARRYRASWQAELVRYVVHGLLHLSGYDDRHPREQRRMKAQEDRLCRALAGRFPLSKLGIDSTVSL